MSVMRWMLIAMLALAGGASAQDDLSHRIAYVNVPWILNNSPQVKAVEAELKKTFSHREEDLRQREEELDDIEDRLRDDTEDLGEDDIRRLERDLVAGKRRLKIAKQEFQEDLALRQNEEINKLRRQISEVIQAVAKDKGLDMVFETAVVYVSDRVDISKDVLQRLQSQYGADRGPEPATRPATAR